MAETKLVIEFTYENNVSFEMTSKLGTADPKTILSLEENACLPKLWEAGIHATIMAYLEHEVKKIGAEMKAPPP